MKKKGQIAELQKKNRELFQKLKEYEIKEKKEEEEIIDENVLKLVEEGYPLETLKVVKKNIHSSCLRRTLRSLIKRYSIHESAKPQRLRMKTILEIISSENVYLEQLRICLKNYYHPLLMECKKIKKNSYFLHLDFNIKI